MSANKIVRIKTLGQFQVFCHDQAVTESAGRSYKLWDLFRLLLVNRSKGLSPEQIMERLWSEQELDNERGALRTLVYRLRKVLELGTAGCCSVALNNGAYSLSLSEQVEVDVDCFEQGARAGAALLEASPLEAIDALRKAVEHYQGEFLAESAYFEWVFPARNYYHRLYMESVFSLAQLLDQSSLHAERAKLCEKALGLEPYDEELNLILMDALIKGGKKRQALNHYEYITAKLYRELGVKPSQAMRGLYRQLKSGDTVRLDLGSIQHGLRTTEEQGGAFLCDTDVFRSVYELERRRGERTGQAVFLCLLTIMSDQYTVLSPPVLKECMEKLKLVLCDSLRRGDVVTVWNEAQCLVILPGLKQDNAEMVLNRVHTRFLSQCRAHAVALKTSAQPVLPPLAFTTA